MVKDNPKVITFITFKYAKDTGRKTSVEGRSWVLSDPGLVFGIFETNKWSRNTEKWSGLEIYICKSLICSNRSWYHNPAIITL